jgi:hypothetical protein
MGQQTTLNFYNTTRLEGQEHLEAQVSAKNQGLRVLIIMKEADMELTPFEVSKLYDAKHSPCPITSIRRAMTDLTKCGLLIKTEKKQVEVYGCPNYKWRVA